MSLLTPGQNGRNSLFLFCIFFFLFLSSLFFSVFSHGQAPRQFHKEGSSGSNSGGPKAAKHRGKVSEAVGPREWGKPHCFFFSLSSHHLAPDVSTTMGSAQKTGVTKANFLARGPRRKSQRTRKYQGYGRERGAWQSGLAPKPVVYKLLGSPLRCAYWI